MSAATEWREETGPRSGDKGDGERLTVDVAESTRFALLGVVETTGPVDGNVALVS